jgi:dipeptidyl aminopeptidase/acylaminoacyl peptidase
MASGTRKQVFRDADNDPDTIIHQVGGGVIAATIMGGKPRTIFFDPGSSEARLYRSLEAVFPGDRVEITSATTDGHLVIVGVSSDRNPGDYYLFDTIAKKADHVISHRDWLDPADMSEVRSFDFKARDGMKLYGYLTMPHGPGKNLPMVVLPHGGPFGIYDSWTFEPETQLLAAAGYVVLQVNYRGSGGHGQAYQRAGARQWGLAMQNDITDATRWAVAEGIADGQRICIFGGSYGGYAALMGAAKEPALYKCAVGYAGIYDLPLVVNSGGLADSSQAYLKRWVGTPASLVAVSPVNLARQIKVPVFLAAGGQDETAPIAHSERMEKALRAAGVPVETLFIRTEGHGFFVEDHRKQFYNQLLGFLDKNIGSGAAAGAGASTAATQH